MDYFPTNEAELMPWSKNLVTEITAVNDKLKLPAEDVAAAIAALNTMMAKMDAAADAVAQASKLVSEKTAVKKMSKSLVRAFVRQAKASPNYTDEIGKTLGVYVAPVSTSLVDYKPVFTAKETGGHIQLGFNKNGVHGLNIYVQLPGATVFTLLATAIQSPYIDMRPLAKAGVTELRQYKAMAIEKNVEVGQWSEIISISYSG